MSSLRSAALAAILIAMVSNNSTGQDPEIHTLAGTYIGGYGDPEIPDEWQAGRTEAINGAKAIAHLELSLIQIPSLMMDYLLMPTGIQYSQEIEIVSEGPVFITGFDSGNPSYEPFGGPPTLLWSGPWLVKYEIKYRFVDQ